MKKWILVALLFVVLFLSQLSAITFRVEVKSYTRPTTVYLNVTITPPAGGGNPWTINNVVMTDIGPGAPGYRLYSYTNTSPNYWDGFTATASCGSQSSSTCGMVGWSDVVTLAPITMPDPRTTPTPK